MNHESHVGQEPVVSSAFLSFGFSDAVHTAISRIGYTEPTEIQAKTFSILLKGKDLVGQSKTGSGKTAAYMLPSLNLIMNNPGVTLVLVPTRELALQAEDFVKKLVPRISPVRMVSIIGGGSMSYQVKMLRQKPNLIFATPGRLVDHLSHGNINFDDLKVLILDEADRMLDMGFYPQIQRILAKLPAQRQNILFSATFSDDVRKLTRQLTRDAVEVSVGQKNVAPTSIHQEVLEVSIEKKNDLLLDQLNAREGSILVFAKTRHKTEKLMKYLCEYGYKVTRIHGDRTLAQRRLAIQNFKAGHVRILLATDIAARGLDIAQVGHVINFDLPQNADDYLHRIGRTGRAGAVGQAVSFVSPEDRRQWQMIIRNSQTASGANGALSLPGRDRRQSSGKGGSGHASSQTSRQNAGGAGGRSGGRDERPRGLRAQAIGRRGSPRRYSLGDEAPSRYRRK